MEEQQQSIDSRLHDDCHKIFQCQSIQVLLHKNALVPWFILVPLLKEHPMRELFELPAEERALLAEVSDLISGYLVRRFDAEKINVASIGNIVDQLHWHVVGRRSDDCCWPAPVWGNIKDFRAWQDDDLARITREVERLLDVLI